MRIAISNFRIMCSHFSLVWYLRSIFWDSWNVWEALIGYFYKKMYRDFMWTRVALNSARKNRRIWKGHRNKTESKRLYRIQWKAIVSDDLELNLTQKSTSLWVLCCAYVKSDHTNMPCSLSMSTEPLYR